MKTYKVTIYPVTPWTVRIKAKNENEAKRKALKLEAPTDYAYKEDNEWYHDIMEWPNIGNGIIDVEEDD